MPKKKEPEAPSQRELVKRLKGLVAARHAYYSLGKELEEKKLAWEEKNASLIKEVERASLALEREDAAVRGIALAIYNKTDNRAPGPGVSIRLIQSVELSTDERMVDRWVRSNLPIALKVDLKVLKDFMLSRSGSLVPEEIGQVKEVASVAVNRTIDVDE